MRGRGADRLVVVVKALSWGWSEGGGSSGFVWWSTRVPGRSQVSGSRSQGKPFEIPKQMVWEAYQRVKANNGAAGVAGQSAWHFALHVGHPICRLWKRVSCWGACR